jgi:hypothetical protein
LEGSRGGKGGKIAALYVNGHTRECYGVRRHSLIPEGSGHRSCKRKDT